MRRSKRFKSMARSARSTRRLFGRLWRAASWLLIAALLLAASLPGGSSAERAEGLWKWAAIASGFAAPFAAIALEPRRPRHPSQIFTFTAYLIVIAVAVVFAREWVLTRANSFYTAALLTEGALLLYILHAIQAVMRRISPPPTTAAPRAADAFVDGVRVLLIGFFVSSAVGWRPLAVIMLLLALGFAMFAVIFRSPGALARLVSAAP
jgi:hypothetical protein